MPETPRSEEPLGSAYIEDLTVPRVGAPATGPVEELSSSALAEDVEAAVLAEGVEAAVLAEGVEAADAAGGAGGDALIGSLISGRYRVEALIGEGGMGAVYRGEQVHLRKHVAIKLLRPLARRMPELVARFEREAVAGAHIRHPNVVAAIDFGQLDDASFFLILEYVEGTPLKDVIAAGRLQPARALRIARQLASALSATHEKGIVHRDVKPLNILLDAHDQVRLIDFGLAKVDVDLLSSQRRETTSPRPALTSAGEVFGTLAYLAPEALRGMDAVDARADLYALGLVLYEMLTGRHPFDTKNIVERLKQQGPDGPPPLRLRAPDLVVPYEVEQVVARLMEHDASFRYQTAADAIAALDDGLAALARATAPAAVGSGAHAGAAAGAHAAQGAQAAAGAQALQGTQAAQGTHAAQGTQAAQRAHAAQGAHAAQEAPRAAQGAPRALAPPAWSGPRKTLLAHAHRRSAPSAGWVPLAAALAAVTVLAIGGATWLVLRQPSATTAAPAPASVVEPPPAPAAPPPATTASAPPEEDDDRGAAGLRAQLSRAVAIRNWVLGAQSMLALAEADPELILSRGLREEVLSTVAGIAFEEGNPAADEVFDLLTNRLGSGGLDVLLDITRARGGTKSARRASEILTRPAVMARATPALRVTFAFRKATCNGKRALFGRAAAEGDERTLFELQVLHGARCRRTDPCCFREDKAIAEAIQQLKARLGT
ncbi:protein kinase domain-containing protein [Sorangium sp. So ce362]|uniref:serine/threonine-protein kinase n=1 Tax=Sorangium sp. So ce362 TaxID=3133303 RepID=UPI003F5F478B